MTCPATFILAPTCQYGGCLDCPEHMTEIRCGLALGHVGHHLANYPGGTASIIFDASAIIALPMERKE